MKKAVVVVIRNEEGEILILKRGEDHKLFPGEWCFPGGKLDWYQAEAKVKLSDTADAFVTQFVQQEETWIEAAVRETREETGIQLIDILDMGEWLADEFFVVKVFNTIVRGAQARVTREMPNREHVEAMWVNPTNMPPNIGRMTQRHLENVFDGIVTL